MGREGLEYTIRAKDESERVLRGALNNIRGFANLSARAISAPFQALGSLQVMALRSNVQALRGMGNELDRFIESGLQLPVVRRAFEAATGQQGRAAERLARRLQDATGAALTLTQSMQLANRAMAMGVGQRDLVTILDFLGRKAPAIGVDTAAAIDRVMTSLARGSTRALAEFGIIIDGVEEIKKAFDAEHGRGAFDNLGPAQQRVELIRAAVAEMRREVQRLGVMGDELLFAMSWRVHIADARDRLMEAVVTSERFGQVLSGVLDTVEGIARSIGGEDQGRALAMLGGHFRNILGAVFVDLGELLTHRLIEAARGFVPVMVRAVEQIGDHLGTVFREAIEFAEARIMLLAERIPLLGVRLTDAERQAAQDVAGRGFSGLRLNLGDLAQGGQGPAFGRTAAAIGAMVGDVRGADFGRDFFERQDAAARRRAGQRGGRDIRRDLMQAEARLRMLQRFEERGGIAPDLRGRAVGELQRAMERDPELRFLTREERRERIQRRGQELQAGELQAVAARRDRLQREHDEQVRRRQEAIDARRGGRRPAIGAGHEDPAFIRGPAMLPAELMPAADKMAVAADKLDAAADKLGAVAVVAQHGPAAFFAPHGPPAGLAPRGHRPPPAPTRGGMVRDFFRRLASGEQVTVDERTMAVARGSAMLGLGLGGMAGALPAAGLAGGVGALGKVGALLSGDLAIRGGIEALMGRPPGTGEMAGIGAAGGAARGFGLGALMEMAAGGGARSALMRGGKFGLIGAALMGGFQLLQGAVTGGGREQAAGSVDRAADELAAAGETLLQAAQRNRLAVRELTEVVALI